jgi:hypothetical protein
MNLKIILKESKKILKQNAKFIFWILLVLSIDYLILFFVESILPGYVINHFNLNFLLLVILGGWLFFPYFSSKKLFAKNSFKLPLFFIITIFFISTWFILYKLLNWELAVFFLFLIIIGRLVYKQFSTK